MASAALARNELTTMGTFEQVRLILYKPKGPLGLSIGKLTGSKYTHIALEIQGTVFNVTRALGSTITPFSSLPLEGLEVEYRVLRVPSTPDLCVKATWFFPLFKRVEWFNTLRHYLFPTHPVQPWNCIFATRLLLLGLFNIDTPDTIRTVDQLIHYLEENYGELILNPQTPRAIADSPSTQSGSLD